MESINVGKIVTKTEPQDNFKNEMVKSVKGINIHKINICSRVEHLIFISFKGFWLFTEISI